MDSNFFEAEKLIVRWGLSAMKGSAVTLIILMMFITSAMIAVGAIYTAR